MCGKDVYGCHCYDPEDVCAKPLGESVLQECVLVWLLTQALRRAHDELNATPSANPFLCPQSNPARRTLTTIHNLQWFGHGKV